MDVSKIAVVGDAFEKFSVESADAKQIVAKVSFRGNAKSPADIRGLKARVWVRISDQLAEH